jgi:hypothetical protein
MDVHSTAILERKEISAQNRRLLVGNSYAQRILLPGVPVAYLFEVFAMQPSPAAQALRHGIENPGQLRGKVGCQKSQDENTLLLKQVILPSVPAVGIRIT